MMKPLKIGLLVVGVLIVGTLLTLHVTGLPPGTNTSLRSGTIGAFSSETCRNMGACRQLRVPVSDLTRGVS